MKQIDIDEFNLEEILRTLNENQQELYEKLDDIRKEVKRIAAKIDYSPSE